MDINTNWKKIPSSIFWGEIAPCEHVLQVYESDEVFIDALSHFVGSGINAGDSVIVIATNNHLKALNFSLLEHGIYIDSLISDGGYIPLNAEETLAKFMVDGWPDETLFRETINEVFARAKKGDRKVRAFGEMVAILWAQGHHGATVQLEHLWNKFMLSERFPLFCAYPKSGFTDNIHSSMNKICCSHSKMIAGHEKQTGQVIYQPIETRAAV